jgi:hypothetical protein
MHFPKTVGPTPADVEMLIARHLITVADLADHYNRALLS